MVNGSWLKAARPGPGAATWGGGAAAPRGIKYNTRAQFKDFSFKVPKSKASKFQRFEISNFQNLKFQCVKASKPQDPNIPR